MKIAVLGGAGFLGSRLSELLNDSSDQVSIYDINSQVPRVTKIDVRQKESLEIIAEADVLINLAAVHRDDVKPLSRYHDVNVTGARNICGVAEDRDINNIIFISSVAVYGFALPDIDEEGAHKPFNEYGKTKSEAESIFIKWQEKLPETRSLVIIRPTVIFGEGNRGNVYNLFSQIAARRFVMFGSGSNVKSIAYVANVAAFIKYSLSFSSGIHVFNYVDKPDFDMNQLVGKARQVLFRKNNVGIRLPAFVGMLIGWCADFVGRFFSKPLPISSIRVKKFMSTTKFQSAVYNTDFLPPVKLEDAIESTLNYEFIEENSDKRTFYTE